MYISIKMYMDMYTGTDTDTDIDIPKDKFFKALAFKFPWQGEG